MKRTLLCMLVALSFSISVNAQLWDYSKSDTKWTFGVRAGTNYSLMHYYDYKGEWSVYAGFVADYNIVKSLSIETGLSFIQMNGVFQTIVPPYVGPCYSIGSLQLPVLALYKYPLSSKRHLQVKAGGYLGTPFQVDDPDINYSSVFGILMGLGLKYNHLYLGAQYEMDMNNSGYCIDDGFYFKSRNLSIMIGYDF